MTSRVPSYRGYRFPPEIISHALWLYHRFGLSLRDVEDLLAQRYLSKADSIPHRAEGEWVLLECLPSPLERVLDLGSGDGRLLAVVTGVQPRTHAVAIDFSEVMLEGLRARFADDPRVTIVAHDLDRALPESLGVFDAIVSSFAIHHLAHPASAASTKRCTPDSIRVAYSAILNMSHRQPAPCTNSS